MNKADLVNLVAARTELTKTDVSMVVDAAIETIIDSVVEGKKVSKVMVEGKDFFDGDSKLATQNIPADALDEIEVLKNYNEIDQLRGLGNDQDNIALNVKLKEGKKNFWFGDIGAGGGPDERFGFKPNLFYYSPKTSVNILSDWNNLGDIPFTFNDYLRFRGGISSLLSGGTNFTLPQDIGMLMMKNDRAYDIDTKFTAVNLGYYKKKWSVDGFGIYSGISTEMRESGFRRYLNNATGVTDETTQQQIDQQSDMVWGVDRQVLGTCPKSTRTAYPLRSSERPTATPVAAISNAAQLRAMWD